MNKKNILYILIAAAVILVGSYFRLFPLLYPSSPQAEQKAGALIFNQIRADVTQNIRQHYPQLNEAQSRSLVEQELQKILLKKKLLIQRSIFQLAQKIYARDLLENPSKKEPEIYLPDSDSYYFYGMTKQLAEHKKIMTQRKGAEYFNEMMLAPVGYWEKINLHPFVGFWTYKLIHIINPHTSLMLAVSFVPLLLTIFSIFLFLLLLRHLQINAAASFVGTLLFALSPMFLRRSFLGWYDNDIYNIFFPLLIFYLTFLGLEKNTHKIKQYFFAIAIALTMICYAFFWQGWVYLFCLLFASGLLILIMDFFIFNEKSSVISIISFFGTIFVTALIGVMIFFGFSQSLFLFKEGWSVLSEFFHSSAISLWPDMYMSVGELGRPSWPDLLELVGNISWFLLALLGTICFTIDHHMASSKKMIYKMTIVFVSVIATLALSLNAQRFVLLLIMPLGLLASYGLEKIFVATDRLIKKINPYKNFYLTGKIIVFGLITIFFIFNPIDHAYTLALRIRPIFNETWERALLDLKEKTPKESIINSWWPPGHFIKAIAERRVTFDGATINVPQAFWMARALYGHDEQKALGILRMLNTSANKATEYLLSQGKKLSQAVEIIEQIVVLPENKAKEVLLKQLTEEQAGRLLLLTHGHPPPSYLFVYNDMLETNIGIGFAARWNIKKMEQINENPALLQQVRKLNRTDYINFLWDIQGGMLRYSETLNQIDQKDQKVYFDNGIMLDLDGLYVQASSQKFGVGTPQNLYFYSDTGPIKKTFTNASLPYSVFVSRVCNGRYTCILMDEVIAESLLVRLYFWGPNVFKYIEPFLDAHDDVGETQLFAFRINWNKFLDDLVSRP